MLVPISCDGLLDKHDSRAIERGSHANESVGESLPCDSRGISRAGEPLDRDGEAIHRARLADDREGELLPRAP